MPTPAYLTDALDALKLAEPKYEEAHDYYTGEIGEVFSSAKLRELIGPTGHRYRVNFARTPVDVLLERTTMNAIECSDAGALATLNQVWEDNDLGLEAKDLHRQTYEYGDAYVIGWPNEDLPGGVEAYAHPPGNVRVFYDKQQPRVKSHAIHTWTEYGTGPEGNGLSEGLWQRVALYFPTHVEQWVSENRIDAGSALGANLIGTDTEFIPYIIEGSGEDGIIENPVPGVVPVFHFRTARPYGRPEHADAFGPQDMINKLNITMMTSVDFAGFPQRYVLTDSALNPDAETDNFGPPPDDTLTTDGGLPGIDDDSSLKAGPGETWFLSGARLSVGQFQVSETQNFLNATESLIKQMASVTDVPAYYFDKSSAMPSGESFRRAEAPLNKKLDDRLALLGVTWHEFFDYCLQVNNQAPSDAHIAWDPPEVYSDGESWDTAKKQQDAGVGRVQTLIERGYTQEQAEQWDEEKKAAAPAIPQPTPPQQPDAPSTPPASAEVA
jgi:hypothetical protein